MKVGIRKKEDVILLAKRLTRSMRPARLERATFWFVAVHDPLGRLPSGSYGVLIRCIYRFLWPWQILLFSPAVDSKGND